MRISDWSSDVCSSDLHTPCASADIQQAPNSAAAEHRLHGGLNFRLRYMKRSNGVPFARMLSEIMFGRLSAIIAHSREPRQIRFHPQRSEEHTSELQSLMRISYAVFCLKKQIKTLDLMTSTDDHYSMIPTQPKS